MPTVLGNLLRLLKITIEVTIEVIVGFTVDAIVGSTSVSAVEVSAVVPCVGLNCCGAECNAAGANGAAMVCGVALENGTFIAPLGDTTFIIAQDDSRVLWTTSFLSRRWAIPYLVLHRTIPQRKLY